MTDDPKKYPRGHAYVEIKNGGLFTRMDFPAKDVPLLEEIRKDAMDRMAEWKREEAKEEQLKQRDTPWREWWAKNGHRTVAPAEMRSWVAKVEREQGEAKARSYSSAGSRRRRRGNDEEDAAPVDTLWR